MFEKTDPELSESPRIKIAKYVAAHKEVSDAPICCYACSLTSLRVSKASLQLASYFGLGEGEIEGCKRSRHHHVTDNKRHLSPSLSLSLSETTEERQSHYLPKLPPIRWTD